MENVAQLKIGKRGVERTPVTAKVADAAGDGASSEDSHRVALARLRDLVCTDRIGTSGRLPAERLLAAELGVSRRSLRHALDILEAEGRITRHQGRGTFLTDARIGTESLVRKPTKP